MELSLLERLSQEVPEGRRNSREVMEAVREWVRMHESEIVEARNRGYSWRQIGEKTAEMWKTAGKFPSVYMHKDNSLIGDSLKDIKKGTKSQHAKGSQKGYLLREM